MPTMLHHLPAALAVALLTAAPLLAVAVAWVVVGARRRALAPRRVAVLGAVTGALGVHLVAVLAVTGFWVLGGVNDAFAPLSLGASDVQWVPLDYLAAHVRGGLSASETVQIVGNVLLLLPLGVLVPLVAGRDPGWARMAGLAVAAPVAIEAGQFLLGSGHPSIDDVLLNTCGALTGYAAYRVVAAARVGRRPEAVT